MADISDRIGNALFGPKGSLVDAYNQEIDRRSGPFGLEPAKTRAGAAAQMPLSMIEGLGGIADYLLDTPQAMGEATLEYLTGPSKFQRDLEAGLIQESELPLGTDLADIEGSGVGVPDFVPEDYVPGETFTYDPTGEGLTKDIDAALKELYGDLTPGPKTRGGPAALRKAKEEQEAIQRAEEFRANEAKIAEDKGGLQSVTLADSKDAAEQMFVAGMQDFIDGARGAGPSSPEVKSIDDYKKEFADATGISIDGKPDKSQALMAFGLALMQNKAKGKGIGGMLDAVGKAGTAALPALEKAKEQARLDGLAAGKFALEAQSADQAKAAAAREKAMERTDYFVVPKSDDVKGFLAGLGEGRGRLESLSKYEVDKLLKNPEFAKKFDILPGSTWGTVVTEALKTPDGSALWDDKVQSRSLIPEITEPLLEIDISYGKPGTSTEGRYVVRDAQQIRVAEDQLARMSRDLRKAKQEFIDLGILTDGERNIFTYGIDKLNSLARVAGVEFGSEATETDKINMILKRLQVKNAADILGEAGKTISDGDRALVAEIVSDIKAGSDIRLIREKTQKLFNDIIGNTEQNILQGLQNLSRYSGRDYGLNSDQPMSDEEYEELLRYRKGEA